MKHYIYNFSKLSVKEGKIISSIVENCRTDFIYLIAQQCDLWLYNTAKFRMLNPWRGSFSTDGQKTLKEHILNKITQAEELGHDR